MSLKDITSQEAILKAVEEFDRLGEDEFLSRYGYGKAKEYFLIIKGKSYPSKAIVGVAHGYQFPNLGPLSAYEFTGGEHSVKAKLEALGFEVQVGVRKTYLFGWNPRKWHWESLSEMSKDVREGKVVVDNWSCGKNKQIKVGDRAFLIRLGIEPKGIMASGKVISEPFFGPHWDQDKAALGERVLFVNVQFDALLNPDEDIILSRDILNQPIFSDMHWDTQISGVRIPDEIASKLEEVWAEVLLMNNINPPTNIDYRSIELGKYFIEIMDNYLLAKRNPQLRHPISDAFKALEGQFRKFPQIFHQGNIIVKHRMGIGDMANVPSLAFLDTRVTNTTQQGIYCVYLFKADMSGVYITFNQGIGRTGSKVPTSSDVKRIHLKALEIRGQVSDLANFGFILDDNIDLADISLTGTGRAYEKSTIAYKYYDKNNFPSDEALISDLDQVLRAYQQYLSDFVLYEPKLPEEEKPIIEEPKEEYIVEFELQPLYTIADFIYETGFSEEVIKNWLLLLRRKKQIIIQGPPGTGKTFIAERLARLLVSRSTGFWDVIQFHPAYSYEDFIQGYFPEPVDGILNFSLRSGRFLEFCQRAGELSIDSPCILIIDEINRANLARVFGELMYLLEYRDKEIVLASGGNSFKIPLNVYIVGTMNTADRSIALVDHALRRRFSFIRLRPEYEILRSVLVKHDLPANSLISVLQDINRVIDDPNYELGISFFIKDIELLKEHLPYIWISEIEPYLDEYFYDSPGKVKPYRWESLSQNELRDWAS